MEVLHNGFTLELSSGAFPLSTDSIALSGFVRLPKNAKVLDLGSGCGTLGLLLCAKDASCEVTGVELDQAAHEMALHNAKANNVSCRLTSICENISNIPHFIQSGAMTTVVSNPPYFSGGPAAKLTLARRDDLCSMDTLMKNAAWALQFGGDFFVVHRPERLAELFACAAKYKLEPKRLQLLRHTEAGPVSLVLVQCRKGAKPGLVWEEEFLYDQDGNSSLYRNHLYHL